MIPARQVVALVVLALIAAVAGFAGASALRGSSHPAAAPPAPAAEAAPAPAIPPTDPVEPVVPPEAPAPPDPAPSVTAPPTTTREAPPAPVRTTTRPRTTRPPAPATPPGTTTAARPVTPPPVTAPPATTAPPTVTAPLGPPASALAVAPAPPTGIAITPETAITGVDPAHRVLARAYATSEPGSVERADLARSLALWRAYLSPDAPGAPDGRRATIARAVRANAWWFASRGAPRGRVLLRDEDGVILTYRAGQGFVVNPVATTGRWRGLNDDVPAATLAASLMEMGVVRSFGETRFTVWEYYDQDSDPDAIVPGASGMAQARLALLFAHAQAETADPRFAEAALSALRAFTVDADAGGVRTMVRVRADEVPVPWYVERAYPGENPWKGGALNGFMVTILNLRGAAQILDGVTGGGDAAAAAVTMARDLADRGAVSLRRHLPDHDSGAWSYYGLLTPGHPWRTYLADLNYHCYHIRLLAQLDDIYPDRGFGATSDTWQGYVDRAGLTCPSR